MILNPYRFAAAPTGPVQTYTTHFTDAVLGPDWGPVQSHSEFNVDGVTNAGTISSNFQQYASLCINPAAAVSNANIDIEALVLTGTTNSNMIAALIARSDGTGRPFYYAGASGGGNWEITHINNVGQTTVLASVPYDGTTNSYQTYRFSAIGSMLTLFVDGVEKVSVTDTLITTGNFGGIRGRRNSVRFDTYTVVDP